MSTTFRAFAVVSVILIGMAIPAVAETPKPATSLEAIVGQTVTQLQPFAQQRNVTFAVQATGSTELCSAEQVLAQDRITNLIANAIAMAPVGSTVNLAVNDDDVCVWFANQNETFTVDRNVEDSTGNSFRVRSVAGKGTELSFSLDRAVVSAP